MSTKKNAPETEHSDPPKRKHRATYASNKREGGYLIRVAGPHASRFLGREVPVTRKDGSESMEMLTHLLWSGPDNETGEPVALYRFEAKEREESETAF